MINTKVVRFVKINILKIRNIFVAAKITENKYYFQEDRKNLVTGGNSLVSHVKCILQDIYIGTSI